MSPPGRAWRASCSSTVSCRLLYGGSQNTISNNWLGLRFDHVLALMFKMVALSSRPSEVQLLWVTPIASLSMSRRMAVFAPRLNASKATAPLPVKASNMRRPSMSPRVLNSAVRIRSPMGWVAKPLGAEN